MSLGEYSLASDEKMQQQLVELQTQLAYQEDMLRELNDAMSGQQQEILILRRQLELLKQRQDEQSEGGSGAGPGAEPGEEKPPHY